MFDELASFKVLRALPIPVLIKDAEHRFLFVNEEAASYFGVPADSLVGKTDFDFFPPEQAALYQSIDRRVWATGAPLENEETLDAHDGITHTLVARKALVDVGSRKYLMVTLQNITALRDFERKVRYLAYHDALTGLPNRTTLYENLARALSKGVNQSGHLALLLIDLDGFKKTNDSYGHQAGDELLQAFARRLKSLTTDADLVVRMGGDEFAVFVSSNWRDRLDQLCLQVIETASKPFEVVGVLSFVNASIGVVLLGDNESSSSEILRKADVALYEAKYRGKGQHVVYTAEFDASLSLRQTIEAGLIRSLDEESGLSCAYQPIICARSGAVTGVEALARWEHPQLGSVPPMQFIPVAEETGLINRLGEWILMRACREARHWSIDLLAVNISPLQLRDGGFAERVLAILKQENFPANRLELEITEAAVMHADGASIEQLRQLRAADVRIALDDFGTGYSSLRLLQELTLDKIKIDRSFVQSVTEAGDSAAIVEGLARLGTKLGLEVVAEGVEQDEQRAFLFDAGCSGMQGFLFSRPVSADKISALLYEKRDIEVTAGRGV